MATPVNDRPPSPSPSQLPIPSSPTFTYASTANVLSSYTLPLPPPPRPPHAILTKADLEASQTAYADLLSTAKAYRQALATLSTTASAFGASLEACARLKESRAEALGPLPGLGGGGGGGGPSLSNSYTAHKQGSCTADLLLGASGVHHLVANHQQILSETVYRSFEVPLLHELDKWRAAIDDEDERYRREAAARSQEIRRLEKEGLKLHKQRRRDVSKFREHLVELTSRLDGLTALHGDHARTLLRESQETSVKILDASCSLVRAEVDIFESLARKGWSGGGLDELLEKGRDLFASEDDALVGAGIVGTAGAHNGVDGAKLFSILPPRSILQQGDSGVRFGTGGSGKPRGHGRADSLLVDTDRYQSLTGAVDRERGDNESIFSDFNQSRGVRPFSPQPIRRNHTDVMLDPDSLFLGDDEGEGARDVTAQSLTLERQRDSEEEESEEDGASPWKDEGLRNASGGAHSPGSTVKGRSRRWSASDKDENSSERG
ncbi:phospholipid-binding protein [Apiospora hydei]|uniref:Phospholipid-binding protein n=1 Tax=Apiospora hydei TaxID=1337664 RepID=A0ABR1VUL3_9PEZI